MDIYENVKLILEENGIEINELDSIVNIDSISFISAIVDIEQVFHLEFPDEYLMNDLLNNVEDFVNIIKQLLADFPRPE